MVSERLCTELGVEGGVEKREMEGKGIITGWSGRWGRGLLVLEGVWSTSPRDWERVGIREGIPSTGTTLPTSLRS